MNALDLCTTGLSNENVELLRTLYLLGRPFLPSKEDYQNMLHELRRIMDDVNVTETGKNFAYTATLVGALMSQHPELAVLFSHGFHDRTMVFCNSSEDYCDDVRFLVQRTFNPLVATSGQVKLENLDLFSVFRHPVNGDRVLLVRHRDFVVTKVDENNNLVSDVQFPLKVKGHKVVEVLAKPTLSTR